MKKTKCINCANFYSNCTYWSTTNLGLYNPHNDSPKRLQYHKCFKKKSKQSMTKEG